MLNPTRLKQYIRRGALLFLVGCTIVIAIAVVVICVTPNPEQNAISFIRSAIEGTEDSALTYLSPELKIKVRQDCPGGLVTKCIQRLIPSSWGKLTGIASVVLQPATNSLLLHTSWANLPGEAIPIVILTDNDKGPWVIRGWRGFIRVQRGAEDGQLLDGMRHDNEFIAYLLSTLQFPASQ